MQAPLGDEVLANYKKDMGMDPTKFFDVSDEVYAEYKNTFAARGQEMHKAWDAMFERYAQAYPEKAAQFKRIFVDKKLPEGWKDKVLTYTMESKLGATRNYGGDVLRSITPNVPELIGGSADLQAWSNAELRRRCSSKYYPECARINWWICRSD